MSSPRLSIPETAKMPSSHWPGGIPAYVRVDEKPIPYDDIEGLTNGWRCFIKEKWVTPPPTEQDPLKVRQALVEQRRALAAEWAQAPQALRNDYQTRAASNPTKWNYQELKQFVAKKEVPNGGSYWYTCIAPLNTPRNLALWTKLRILSYDFYYSNEGITTPGVLVASPYSEPPILEPKDFMKAFALENADFMNMAMTKNGTVVFRFAKRFLADQHSLETGMLLCLDFDSNGNVGMRMRFGVLELESFNNQFIGMGRSVNWMRHWSGSDDEEEVEPTFGHKIDITRPILDIFADVEAGVISPDTGNHLDGGENKWRKLIEENAPGYLAFEEAGNPEDYDHSNFREI
ncbi:uncharacterized protein PAC_08729 [Phialocephala subalpina]|uniref:Uncharacterized protein n=1 Tax=Phialocephala subalpina TaxID=576137 RepID=A0A1L7X1E9_9HELO|nr:uncharacterized protein PAC_08729 [Phialocephala subalpina]